MAILERLSKGELGEEETRTIEIMEDYARDGLRTLCIAKRELDENTMRQTIERYEKAALAIHDRQQLLDECVP